MSHATTISRVREALDSIFAQVEAWFDRPTEMREYELPSGGWSIDRVLEHITLTNKFLLMTLGKWSLVAQQRAKRGDSIPEELSDLEKLLVIGDRGSFGWVRPEHMEPTGNFSMEAIQETLRMQVAECRSQLDRLPDGIGALCSVTMTVNNLGKIDLYQWIFFIAQHARRHLQQMAAIEQEYLLEKGLHGHGFES